MTLATVATTLAFVGCSENAKSAGGGPSGTEAGNAITAQIITGQKPAALAKVRLIDSESIDKDGFSAQTDDNGNVTFESVDKGIYTLEARLNNKAVQMLVQVTDSPNENLIQAELLDVSTVAGTVGANESGTIKVRGLDHEAPVIDGKFTLDSLPAGPLSLVFIPNQGSDTTSSYLNVESGVDASASSFASESKSLLLDDFEDGNMQHRFMPAHTYDGGWWYFDYEKNTVDVEYVTKDEMQLFNIEVDENGNRYAHMKAIFGDEIQDSTTGQTIYPWAVLGLEIGKSEPKTCNDISSVDSVAFLIKNTGSVKFTLVDKSREDSDITELGSSRVSANEEWTRVSISLDKVVGKSNRDVLKCVSQFTWQLEPYDDEVELWLDNLELVGGARTLIWEK